MKKGPVNSSSLKWSCSLHGVALFTVVVVTLLPAFHRKDKQFPQDFTVVLDENLVEPNVPDAPKEEAAKPPTPAPAPEPEPEPEAPPPEPLPEPPKDALVIEKKKPPEKKKEPEKKPEPPKKEPEKKKEPDKKKEPVKKPEPEKKPFVKGKRVEAPSKPAQPKFEDLYKPFDPSKPISLKPLTDKKLSRAEIESALRDGARAGTQNLIPEDEVSRCVVLVRRAMYEAWDQPGAGDGGQRPCLLDIRIDASGRVVSYHIRQSSGSSVFDQTVLKAAAGVPPIRGLSLAFLKQYETLTVEFKLE